MSRRIDVPQGAGLVGGDRVAELRRRAASRPGSADRIAAIRAAMEQQDRVYLESLAALRRVADLTQVVLAERMGVAQNEVSRIERQHDWLLSTLGSYLTQIGSEPRLLVTIDGRDVELPLTALLRKA